MISTLLSPNKTEILSALISSCSLTEDTGKAVMANKSGAVLMFVSVEFLAVAISVMNKYNNQNRNFELFKHLFVNFFNYLKTL